MPGPESLLAGRNAQVLTDSEVQRVAATIYSLDREAPFRYAAGERTRCRVWVEGAETLCEIVFGADIFPGNSLIDPNAALSMRAAAAHELSHFHRWRDKIEIDDVNLMHIDEALTSLDAVQRYHQELSDTEIRQLVADAMQRLQMFVMGPPQAPEVA